MGDSDCIAYVPRRVLALYEAVSAYPREPCDMTEEALRLADEASEGEHYDAQCFMHMCENQDLLGPVQVVVVYDPTLDRLHCLLSEELN